MVQESALDAVAWSPDLLVRAIVALTTGIVYAYVARLVLSRRLSPEAHRANVAFATWWGTFGIVEFLAAAYNLPAAFGLRDLALAVTLINVLLVLIVVAIAGLMYYLVFLYTGSQRAYWPVVVFYGVLAVALLYLIAWMQPTGFDESQGPGALAYTRQLAGGPAITLGLVFSLPVVVAAIAYGSLYWRTDDAHARFRIATISLSFTAWFGWSAVSSALELGRKYPDSRALLVVNSAITLAAAFLVVAAYKPPAWIAERLARREQASFG